MTNFVVKKKLWKNNKNNITTSPFAKRFKIHQLIIVPRTIQWQNVLTMPSAWIMAQTWERHVHMSCRPLFMQHTSTCMKCIVMKIWNNSQNCNNFCCDKSCLKKLITYNNITTSIFAMHLTMRHAVELHCTILYMYRDGGEVWNIQGGGLMPQVMSTTSLQFMDHS